MRELHDVLAHIVSAISLHAGVALEALPDEPENATAAVRSIREVSGAALSEPLSTVRTVRDPSLAGGQPPGGLADLDRLVATAAKPGCPSPSCALADRSLHRWWWTPPRPASSRSRSPNVLRHSGSTEAVVEVDYRPDAVRLRITDRGGRSARGPADASEDVTEKHSADEGFGITGMPERVELPGGDCRRPALPTADSRCSRYCRSRRPAATRTADRRNL